MSPLPAADFGLPREEYVIVPVTGGKVDGTVLHTPRDKIEPDESPMEATSWCGVTGWVYVRGGAFERRPVCTECAAAKDETGCDPRTGSLIARYNDRLPLLGVPCRDACLSEAVFPGHGEGCPVAEGVPGLWGQDPVAEYPV